MSLMEPYPKKEHHPSCHLGRDAECDCHMYEAPPGEPINWEHALAQVRNSTQQPYPDDQPETLASVVEELRNSLRSRLLFGCFDEPMDDATCRLVRVITTRLEALKGHSSPPIGVKEGQDMHLVKRIEAGIEQFEKLHGAKPTHVSVNLADYHLLSGGQDSGLSGSVGLLLP